MPQHSVGMSLKDGLGEMQQDGYSHDEPALAVGELQKDEDYEEMNSICFFQQEGGNDDEDDTEAVAEVAQDGDDKKREDETAVAQWSNQIQRSFHMSAQLGMISIVLKVYIIRG